MPQKKRYLKLLLACLVLAISIACIYVFFDHSINLTKSSYKLNKYPDIASWCNQKEDNQFACNALLLKIEPQNCFDTLIVSKSGNLEELRICENNSTLSYSNDIIGKKFLLPINITFKFEKTEINKVLNLKDIYIDKSDASYIQNILAADISQIANQKILSQEFPEGEFFCPILNNSAILENEDEVNLYNSNVKTKKSLYTWILDQSLAKSFEEYTNGDYFLCKYYPDRCQSYIIPDVQKILVNLPHITNLDLKQIQWGESPDQLNLDRATYISYLFDISKTVNNKDSVSLITQTTPNNTFKKIFSESNLNEELFCDFYEVYKLASNYDLSYVQDTNLIQEVVQKNITKSNSISCNYVLADDSDKSGLYIKIHTQRNDYRSLCTNLNLYFSK